MDYNRFCFWTPYGNLASQSWFVLLWKVSCMQTCDLKMSVGPHLLQLSLCFDLLPLVLLLWKLIRLTKMELGP